MELNWSTLILEIVNFLVLVWILKRFLYRPVLDVIARRQESIAHAQEEARQQRQAGEELQQRYENRLAEWEAEKAGARKILLHEIEEERARRLQDLEQELESQRSKAMEHMQQEHREAERRLARKGMELGSRFAARLLSRLAGPELERSLAGAMLEDLTALPGEQRERLRQAAHSGDGTIEVTSAFPLDPLQRNALEEELAGLLGQTLSYRFSEDADLIAGLQLRLGSWVLDANLQHELRAFAESVRE